MVPRMRLRTIILQQSLCLISHSSNICGERQFPGWPSPTAACFSPTLPRFDHSADSRPCFLQAKTEQWNMTAYQFLLGTGGHSWVPLLFLLLLQLPSRDFAPFCSPLLHPKIAISFSYLILRLLRFLRWECLSNVFLFKHRIVFKLTNGVFWEWKCG